MSNRILATSEMLAALERVRAAKARLAIQGAPLLYRPKEPEQNPGDPTPQWQAKHGAVTAKDNMGRGVVAPTKRYRVRHPVEQHGERFEMSERTALERFFQDADYANRVKVANWQATGGGAGGRLGGLGEVPQYIREGHARHEWVMRSLSQKTVETARALITRELVKPDGSPFSLEDFGAHLLPSVKDRNRRWGVAAGALVLLADNLASLYRVCPIRVRRISEEERMLELEGPRG